ncbi:hypothetical protein ISN45_Aa01g005970 [Arabidopsis thaliana x Arabidopsis arenosa]|uniref:Uncharacterized protein n=1 Tax=Arabidopsis thaliana x Arabidopsis arenosa TaxID=1240361 RepID=A0A8T2BV49_9BRAS|nr:hypothetical protein ISN45_Aa01g005970 [Arabidopsis thaliana x Arabidopsis arenosa]
MGKRRTRGCRQFWINGVFRYCFKHHLDSARCAHYNASTCQRFSRRTYYKLEGSDHSADKFDIQEEKLSKPDDVTTTSTPLGSDQVQSCDSSTTSANL